MTTDERLIKIETILTELKIDIKWLKDWSVEHKGIHVRYHLMIWGALIGVVVNLIR